MPEGDVLRRVALRLQPLVGQRVQAEAPHPRGAATGVAEAVDGRRLESVEVVGKHLLLRFDGDVVVRSHLRLSGRWEVHHAGAARTGRPWLVLRAEGIEATLWNGPVLELGEGPVRHLGPDLLADGADVAAIVSRLRRADPARLLGDVLLDQRLVAGIGNRWAAEALWQARLSPFLPLAEATDGELHAVLARARAAMRDAVSGARPLRSVHRRAGRPCPRCGASLRSRGLGDANRTAYWCPGCQRGPARS